MKAWYVYDGDGDFTQPSNYILTTINPTCRNGSIFCLFNFLPNSSGDKYPSAECSLFRLYQVSIYSNTIHVAGSLSVN